MNNSIIITPNNAPVSGALFIKNQIKSSLNGGIIILLLLPLFSFSFSFLLLEDVR
jgi:hypothetical protein